MMNNCVEPEWKQRHQRQEEQVGVLVEGEEGNRSSHMQYSQIQQGHQYCQDTVPIMPNYEVAELTWQNGQLAMHGLRATGPTKPPWNRASDTLESIVHQATWPNENLHPPLLKHGHNPANLSSTGKSTTVQSAETLGRMRVGRKRMLPEADQCGGSFGSSIQEEMTACAAASNATFCSKENDATMGTRASFESPWNLQTRSTDEDSACDLDGSENLEDQERETTKGEAGRFHTTRRSRAATVHNQSERRRRDRINQKMKALQKLVPNASKTDKASMLDEVIEYLKQLQAQVHLMSSATRNMPQLMIPAALLLHHQQQIQMSLLARMGMGMGVGVGTGMGPAFLPPPHPFVVPSMIPNHNQAQATTDAAAVRSSVPFNNPYCTFLGQPINMDLYNKMAAVYQQQVSHTSQQTSSPFSSTNVEGGKGHLT